MIKYLSKMLFSWQYTSGKFSAFASLVTMSTVLSLKYEVYFATVFIGCTMIVITASLFFKYSGWMEEELKYVNKLGDLERKLDLLLKKGGCQCQK